MHQGAQPLYRLGILLAWLSLMSHFEPLRNGLVDSRDVAYFVLFTAVFLALAVRRLDSLRVAG